MVNDQQAIIKKMQAAYDEFAAAMAELEKRADDLVRQHLKEIDKEKIDAAMKKIQAL